MPQFDLVTISTQRLLLRPMQPSDAAALFAIHSNEEVMRYWSSLPWTSIEVAHERIARDLRAMQAGEYLDLAIVRIEDDLLIGSCTLFRLDEQCRRAEMGYALLHDAWGFGYMNEALQALLKFGFTELALNRVEADIDPRNTGSAKTLERLGFQEEGYLRERWIVDGVSSDSAIYGLLFSDWQARQ
ncbi:GNAT family N-acetyltransferase [Solimicrobium silvestre]|uniref:Acetyltransferase including N-acetylase of ribosomal protein n=1 Tax=Solimicrobium silvestre TaxID=2099400 RepID=A0A2S9GV46_9BURK|nr:GNAT family N-acetyltransferase [Solimicrobium silvestre]PRC91578.1 Acetyltransferase including N-acetylase of ribosomal protein [Solimicrobium silvestre]